MAITVNNPLFIGKYCVTKESAYHLIAIDEIPAKVVVCVLGLWLVDVSFGNRSIKVRCCGKPNKRDVRKSVKVAKRHIKNN